MSGRIGSGMSPFKSNHTVICSWNCVISAQCDKRFSFRKKYRGSLFELNGCNKRQLEFLDLIARGLKSDRKFT